MRRSWKTTVWNLLLVPLELSNNNPLARQARDAPHASEVEDVVATTESPGSQRFPSYYSSACVSRCVLRLNGTTGRTNEEKERNEWKRMGDTHTQKKSSFVKPTLELCAVYFFFTFGDYCSLRRRTNKLEFIYLHVNSERATHWWCHTQFADWLAPGFVRDGHWLTWQSFRGKDGTSRKGAIPPAGIAGRDSSSFGAKVSLVSNSTEFLFFFFSFPSLLGFLCRLSRCFQPCPDRMTGKWPIFPSDWLDKSEIEKKRKNRKGDERPFLIAVRIPATRFCFYGANSLIISVC